MLAYYQGPQPTPAHHRLSTQRQQSPPGSQSIRSTDSGCSGAFAVPPSKQHPLQLDTTLKNPSVSRAGSASPTYDDRSALDSGNGARRSLESARTMPIPGFRCDRSLQVQDCTLPIHNPFHHVRSSLQDQTIPSVASTARVHPAPSQHWQPSSPLVFSSPYPHHSPIVYSDLLAQPMGR